MQYKQLNELLQNYSSKKNSKCNLKVLAFPCNQFGLQEPGENAYEIINGLRWVRPGHNFTLDPNLKLMEKIDVNGKKESKVYSFLKHRCPVPDNLIDDVEKISWSPVKNDDITWNFEKFLLNHKGQPYRRYTPTVRKEADLIDNTRKFGKSESL